MPDMQTALGKALEEGKRRFLSATLSERDEHEQAIRQPQPPQEKTMNITPITKTGNMRRDLFKLIQHNEHKLTGKMLCDEVERMGYNPASAHSAVTQMKRAKILTSDADSRLYLLTQTYTTFTNPYTPKSKKPKSAGIAALAVPEPEKKPVQIVMHMTAEKVLASIGVAEAHKLYVELGKMFGGK